MPAHPDDEEIPATLRAASTRALAAHSPALHLSAKSGGQSATFTYSP